MWQKRHSLSVCISSRIEHITAPPIHLQLFFDFWAILMAHLPGGPRTCILQTKFVCDLSPKKRCDVSSNHPQQFEPMYFVKARSIWERFGLLRPKNKRFNNLMNVATGCWRKKHEDFRTPQTILSLKLTVLWNFKKEKFFFNPSLSGRFASLRVAYPRGEIPSGAPKEEFGRMIFQKKSSLGDSIKEVRGGTGRCDAPSILDHHCSSAWF